MSRFHNSKFRNAKEKIPHLESWVTGLHVGSAPFSHGNHIKASAAMMAFNVETGNWGTLAVLPIDDKGRKTMSIPLLHAHSGMVTDFDFSPFDDFQLATCSQDGQLRIWDIPETGLTADVSSHLTSSLQQGVPMEVVSYNPSAEGVLAATMKSTLKIFDVGTSKENIVIDAHSDTIQSLSWKQDGRLLVTSCKDKVVRIVDPRQKAITSETEGHENVKDSRVCWFGDGDYVLTTGATKSRMRQAFYFDVRNFKQKVKHVDLDASSGIMIPLFDPDTNMMFLGARYFCFFLVQGDTTLRFFDVLDSSPFLREASKVICKSQHKGIGLVNKRALDVMNCEVNRVLQLTQDGVVPISYEVPRKSHRYFQPELFPDTRGSNPGVAAADWFEGSDGEVKRVSLDPAAREPLKKKSKEAEPVPVKPTASPQKKEEAQKPPKPFKPSSQPKTQLNGTPASATAPPVAAATKKPAPVLKRFTSKFRHINAVPMHRSQHFTSLKKASISTLSECDGFHVNKKWGAVPMSGPGGNIAIIDMKNPSKLPESVPSVQNGSDVTDFAWDPFNDSRLAVSCMNCKVFVWRIQGQSMADFSAEVETELMGHNDRIYLIKFNPVARDVLLSAAQDLTVKIWDIVKGQATITLEGHTDQIYSAAWSPDGKQVVTLCKDGKMRLYEPRVSNSPVQEHNFVSGNKGARVLYVLSGSHIIVSGQVNQSVRRVSLFRVSDLARPVDSVDLGTSPAFLIPCYDEDTNILFLSGKGDSSATMLEVLPEHPYFAELAGFSSKSTHQAFSFLPKTVCAVKDVEVMRGMRQTMSTVEPITFTVPRVKKEYFQDDLFPKTRASWEPSLDSSAWFSGEDGSPQRRVSLQPEGMKPLSEVPKVNAPPPKYTSQEILEMKSDQEKKEEILSAMGNALTLNETPLPQDEMEGVEDDEWDD